MTAHGGPLRGVRVVELASIGPGPHAAMTLADLGADVVRVERPGGTLSAVARDKDVLTRGRPSVAMDLKDPRAASVVLDLVATADVLVEGMRPGVAERLGVGPAECLARNPRLVYGRMTGWGQEGPLAPRAGHDIDYIAVSGSLHGLGRAGGPPQFPQNLLGDFAGGSAYLVIGVLAALLEARTSGQGQVVDAAIVDGTAHLNAMLAGLIAGGAWREERGTNLLDSGAPFYDVYETADGRHMAVGAIEPQFYAELLEGLGLVETALDRSDPRNWPALREALAARFRERTQQEWTGAFEGTDACVSPVLPLTEAARHPHLAARHTYVDRGGVVQPAPAPRFSRTPAALGSPPSLAGQHSREALQAWGVEDVDQLIADGVVTQA
ncbi:MAG TPA: CaiB/BaiF CoA-transferase family protein [Pedococcus sp.]|nr:CaiB/BaiF CoA-transferase family protein [Pedococcus sp.]